MISLSDWINKIEIRRCIHVLQSSCRDGDATWSELESGEAKSSLQLSKLYYLKRGRITWRRRRRRRQRWRQGMKSWAFAFAKTRFYYATQTTCFPVTSCLFARIVVTHKYPITFTRVRWLAFSNANITIVLNRARFNGPKLHETMKISD